jgi:hypothetical protein
MRRTTTILARTGSESPRGVKWKNTRGTIGLALERVALTLNYKELPEFSIRKRDDDVSELSARRAQIFPDQTGRVKVKIKVVCCETEVHRLGDSCRYS